MAGEAILDVPNGGSFLTEDGAWPASGPGGAGPGCHQRLKSHPCNLPTTCPPVKLVGRSGESARVTMSITPRSLDPPRIEREHVVREVDVSMPISAPKADMTCDRLLGAADAKSGTQQAEGSRRARDKASFSTRSGHPSRSGIDCPAIHFRFACSRVGLARETARTALRDGDRGSPAGLRDAWNRRRCGPSEPPLQGLRRTRQASAQTSIIGSGSPSTSRGRQGRPHRPGFRGEVSQRPRLTVEGCDGRGAKPNGR